VTGQKFSISYPTCWIQTRCPFTISTLETPPTWILYSYSTLESPPTWIIKTMTRCPFHLNIWNPAYSDSMHVHTHYLRENQSKDGVRSAADIIHLGGGSHSREINTYIHTYIHMYIPTSGMHAWV